VTATEKETLVPGTRHLAWIFANTRRSEHEKRCVEYKRHIQQHFLTIDLEFDNIHGAPSWVQILTQGAVSGRGFFLYLSVGGREKRCPLKGFLAAAGEREDSV